MIQDWISESLEALKGLDPEGGYCKYLKAGYEIPSKMTLIRALELDCADPMPILDISTCFGWMPYLLKKYGHTVTYTDNISPDRFPLPIEARKRLGLNNCINYHFRKVHSNLRTDAYIFKHVPLPVKKKFDIILASSVDPMSYFNTLSWRFFISNSMAHLNKGGYLYIAPNHSIGEDSLVNILEDYHNEKILKGWRIWK